MHGGRSGGGKAEHVDRITLTPRLELRLLNGGGLPAGLRLAAAGVAQLLLTDC